MVQLSLTGFNLSTERIVSDSVRYSKAFSSFAEITLSKTSLCIIPYICISTDWLIVWCLPPFFNIISALCRRPVHLSMLFMESFFARTPHTILSNVLVAFPRCRWQWTALKEETLSSIFEKNTCRAGLRTNDLLSSNPVRYRINHTDWVLYISRPPSG